MTNSLALLGQTVTVTMDRPLGSKHPHHEFWYPVNYGYIKGVKASDGEDLDAYVLGVFTPLTTFDGRCIAMIHRTNDDDDKLVVVPEGVTYSESQIQALTEFQERFFSSVIFPAAVREVTLVFLVKKTAGKITELCLAMKKRGFGVGRWNGVGGKLELGETVEAAARRETWEEIGVRPQSLTPMAELYFYFPHQPGWHQKVHVFMTEEWSGEPQESEEMKPQWYAADALPMDKMWPDDAFWLPAVLAGQFVRAAFIFGEGDVILTQLVQTAS